MSFEGFPRMTPHMDSFFSASFQKDKTHTHLAEEKATSSMFGKKVSSFSASAIYPCNLPTVCRSHSSAGGSQVFTSASSTSCAEAEFSKGGPKMQF